MVYNTENARLWEVFVSSRTAIWLFKPFISAKKYGTTLKIKGGNTRGYSYTKG